MPLRILLAEDSLANQKLAIGLLTKWGHQVTLATNGREAVAMATSADTFQLVLMDVQMPEMDGFEATKKIREFEQATKRPRLPIVAMTAHAMKGDRERCFQPDGRVRYEAGPLCRVGPHHPGVEFLQSLPGLLHGIARRSGRSFASPLAGYD